ncbi:MAG: bifunctional (p)ppGpp synthetase/guanosine-3',5'-bis(diphosphate) 3'-pyrophosphohydrolase, partial [Gammaproteobacteria bacterium]|nr:bifunctional (p)ppGpp synthetase/guanosine-3',5'-bis(diphosphate) 3'-pyrophosphohydrolase [Gammaproteobacteria bacterium]
MSSLMIQATPIGERVWEWVTSDLQVTLPESEQESAQRAVERVALSVEQIAPQDQEMQVASLLYSYQQRTHSPLPELLVEQVGEPVMQLVEGSAEMTTLHAHQASVTIQSDHQHENLRKMLLAMAKDVRVVVIKLAAHLELMRSPGRLSQQEQVDNALLSRTILAPLANRLGIGVLKWQLEDYTFRTLEPEIYQTLSQQIDLKRREREDYIGAVIETIKAALKKLSLEGEVTGRSKHLYSIWKKMERKKVGVESLYDLNAVRILVESVTECYTALGVVHGLWNHIPKEFDDYIANPKGNNYRSIHTAVFGPEGQVLEIQIRTHNMHEAAELGVASHWRYKEGGRYDPGYERKIEWLRQLLEWKEEVAEQEVLSAPNEPLHSLGTRFRDEMAEEQIYILTPAGEVVELPEGGTALDFAYTIHSGLGHRTRGAKVDGKIVSLNQPLQSGQRVEILTVKEGGPT